MEITWNFVLFLLMLMGVEHTYGDGDVMTFGKNISLTVTKCPALKALTADKSFADCYTQPYEKVTSIQKLQDSTRYKILCHIYLTNYISACNYFGDRAVDEFSAEQLQKLEEIAPSAVCNNLTFVSDSYIKKLLLSSAICEEKVCSDYLLKTESICAVAYYISNVTANHAKIEKLPDVVEHKVEVPSGNVVGQVGHSSTAGVALSPGKSPEPAVPISSSTKEQDSKVPERDAAPPAVVKLPPVVKPPPNVENNPLPPAPAHGDPPQQVSDVDHKQIIAAPKEKETETDSGKNAVQEIEAAPGNPNTNDQTQQNHIAPPQENVLAPHKPELKKPEGPPKNKNPSPVTAPKDTGTNVQLEDQKKPADQSAGKKTDDSKVAVEVNNENGNPADEGGYAQQQDYSVDDEQGAEEKVVKELPDDVEKPLLQVIPNVPVQEVSHKEKQEEKTKDEQKSAEKSDNENVYIGKPISTNDDGVSYPDNVDGDSYFFSYFMMVCIIAALLYVGYHNKQKIRALMLEGPRGRRQYRRKRPNSANYHKLDSNLEEAISSNCNKNSSQIIY